MTKWFRSLLHTLNRNPDSSLASAVNLLLDRLRDAPFGRIAFANTDLAGATDNRYSILEAQRAIVQLLDQVDGTRLTIRPLSEGVRDPLRIRINQRDLGTNSRECLRKVLLKISD
jgi:hypothetical protein